MQIVKSNQFTPEESTVVDNAINAVFGANGQSILSYLPQVSYVISKDPAEHADFLINIGILLNGDTRGKTLELLRLANSVLGGNGAEPRYIFSAYENLFNGGTVAQVVAAEPVVAEVIAHEQVDEVKTEVTQIEEKPKSYGKQQNWSK